MHLYACVHVCIYIYIYIERERERYIHTHVCIYSLKDDPAVLAMAATATRIHSMLHIKFRL